MVGAGFEFLPLDDALAVYEDHRGIAADLGQDERWPKSWLPISHDPAGNPLALDVSEPDAPLTPVLAVALERSEAPVEPSCRSLGELVSWWLEAFDEGIWRYDREARRWQYHWERIDERRTGVL
jgi:hypothetical protein